MADSQRWWSEGNFYGVTAQGGTGGLGTFFQLTPSGTETVLYQFGSNAAGGTLPLTFVAGQDGQFLGVTQTGGVTSACGGLGCGTVYQITPLGQESALHPFQPVSSNSAPFASYAIQTTDGTVHGVTLGGVGSLAREHSSGSVPPVCSPPCTHLALR